MSNPKRNNDRLAVMRFEGISEAIYHGDADLVRELYARQVSRADEAETALVEKEATIARLEAELKKRRKCAPPGTIPPCFPLNSNLAKVHRAESEAMHHD